MLIVSFLYAIGINFDKIIVVNSDPFFGASITLLILGLSFSVMSQCETVKPLFGPLMPPVPDSSPLHDETGLSYPFKNSLIQWIVIGILLSVSAASINTAYTVQIVPYVIAIKRMSIIIIVLYGAFVFGEKEVAKRLFGAVLMVAGAVMIVLSS
jgi:drug/metabolite transporter (DMT)-like permease